MTEQHKLKGGTYSQVYINEEEQAVVTAMRSGAKITAAIFNKSYEEVEQMMDNNNFRTLCNRSSIDYTSGEEPKFIAFSMSNQIAEVVCFVEV